MRSWVPKAGVALLDGAALLLDRHRDLAADLGPHATGAGCGERLELERRLAEHGGGGVDLLGLLLDLEAQLHPGHPADPQGPEVDAAVPPLDLGDVERPAVPGHRLGPGLGRVGALGGVLGSLGRGLGGLGGGLGALVPAEDAHCGVVLGCRGVVRVTDVPRGRSPRWTRAQCPPGRCREANRPR